ncbi:MAG: acyl-CoA dehydrogenase family protein [Conexivisphaerales archaeon]
MLNEEMQLLKQVIEEFSEKEIDPVALSIEREGLTKEVLNSLAEKGFLGALAPVEQGGAGLDGRGYSVLLEVLARHSPSVAMYVFLQNSLFINPLLKYGSNELSQGVIPLIASGKSSGTFVNYLLTGNEITIDGSIIYGVANHIPNGSAQMCLVLAKSASGGQLVLLDKGFKAVNDSRKLGFRGLNFSSISFDGASAKSILISENAEAEIMKIYNESASYISAIALGIGGAALDMAVSYAKERQAFESRLIEFQPIAFLLVKLISEFNVYERYLYGISSVKDSMMLKELALDFSRRASRTSLQVHGGYGYIEDSGIERFYRDSMALELLTGSYTRDRVELSKELLGVESAKY